MQMKKEDYQQNECSFGIIALYASEQTAIPKQRQCPKLFLILIDHRFNGAFRLSRSRSGHCSEFCGDRTADGTDTPHGNTRGLNADVFEEPLSRTPAIPGDF